MIIARVLRSVNVFSVNLKCFCFIRYQKVLYKNSHINLIMPPKRKVIKADAEVESAVDQEPVKQKRGKKAKEPVEANGGDNEVTEEAPKRSTRVKKTVANYTEEVKDPKPEKPKRVTKKKATKEETDSKKEEEPVDPANEDLSEPPEKTKPAKKTKKAANGSAGKEKPVKKTKKAASEPPEAKSNKKTKKALVEADVEEELENGEELEEEVPEKKTKRGAKTKKTQEKSENVFEDVVTPKVSTLV